MNRTPSKLFHAVVISGAALTASCAGPSATRTSTTTSAPSAETVKPEVESKGGGTCPPGSERPYPPCYWIK